MNEKANLGWDKSEKLVEEGWGEGRCKIKPDSCEPAKQQTFSKVK